MNEVTLAIIGLIGTISSIVFAYLAFKRNISNDDRKAGKGEGVLLSDVGYIKSSIDRMEKKLDKVEEQYHDLLTRLIKVEENNISLEKRIERFTKEK